MEGSKLLLAKLAEWAKKYPEKTAIIQTQTGESIAYQGLFDAVSAMHNRLPKNPSTILVALPGGIIDAVLWLSALVGGHLLVPISPQLTEYEYGEIIKQHAPELIISETKEGFSYNGVNVLTASEIETFIKHPRERSANKPREGSVYLSSSGSTGKPKGIILSATQIVLTAESITKAHEITEKDRGLTPLPFSHVNAPVVSLMSAMLTGSTLIIAPKYSTSHFWEWVEKYDPTWISLVPTIIAMLLSTEKPAFLKTASLRFIRTAGAPLPRENLKLFEEKFGIPLIETYGITEAASTIVANPLPPKPHKPGSVGLPIGVDLQIRDPEKDEVLPLGKVGEVVIKGPNVITSYEHAASQEAFSNGWFRTGDLGYVDNEGYVFLTGRIKDIIIRGGENIVPREIEEVLFTYPGVEEAVVVGHPDPIYGERVVAFVVMRQKGLSDISEQIRKYTSEKLSAPKVPTEIHILDSFPRGKSGKIDKVKLRTT